MDMVSHGRAQQDWPHSVFLNILHRLGVLEKIILSTQEKGKNKGNTHPIQQDTGPMMSVQGIIPLPTSRLAC